MCSCRLTFCAVAAAGLRVLRLCVCTAALCFGMWLHASACCGCALPVQCVEFLHCTQSGIIICRRISVNFHSSDGGNNASKPTVDGIEFASENQVCRMCALCNGFLTCRFVSWLPLTPNFKVGILLWHLRTRFYYTQPRFLAPNQTIPQH